jgi:hypothetical protein
MPKITNAMAEDFKTAIVKYNQDMSIDLLSYFDTKGKPYKTILEELKKRLHEELPLFPMFDSLLPPGQNHLAGCLDELRNNPHTVPSIVRIANMIRDTPDAPRARFWLTKIQEYRLYPHRTSPVSHKPHIKDTAKETKAVQKSL